MKTYQHHFIFTVMFALSLFICIFTVCVPAPAIASTTSGYGLIDCRYAIDTISNGNHNLKKMNVTFDIGQLDGEDLVKVFDNITHESVGIYSATLQPFDQHYTLQFKIVNDADDTIFFKLIYPEKRGVATFYTKCEDQRWLNMLNDSVITANTTVSYSGQCRYLPD